MPERDRRRWAARGAALRWTLLLLVALAACAPVPTYDEVAAYLPPIPAGAARIYVYRAFEPYQSLTWVPIFFNGATVGAVGPGHVILRDVPPGTYNIAAKSEGLYPNQDKTVVVNPGDIVYAKVESFISADGGDSISNRPRPIVTFVVVIMDPAVARPEIGRLWFAALRQKEAGFFAEFVQKGQH